MFHWPQDAAAVDTALRRGLTVVLCIAQPPGSDRPVARIRVRQALRSALAAWLDCRSADVVLHSRPGTPVTLQSPPHPVGVSISHDEGLSLVAMAADSRVGVDLLASSQLPDAPECLQLAWEYLGPVAAQALTALPAAHQATAFARAWTAWEAKLKCAGLALGEWTPALEAALHSCAPQPLALPSGYVGAVSRSPLPRMKP